MIVYEEVTEFTKEQCDRVIAMHPGWPFASRVHVLRGELHDGSIFDRFLLREVVSMSAVPSVVFTGPDKALLDRSARAAEAAAKALNWEAIVLPKFRKKAKLEYDRLMRDAHDLRLLGVRLSKYAKSLPKVEALIERRLSSIPDRRDPSMNETHGYDGLERRLSPGHDRRRK